MTCSRAETNTNYRHILEPKNPGTDPTQSETMIDFTEPDIAGIARSLSCGQNNADLDSNAHRIDEDEALGIHLIKKITKGIEAISGTSTRRGRGVRWTCEVDRMTAVPCRGVQNGM